MNVINLNTDADELKIKILDAAEERFQVYGYGKTTMAEIAKDVNMSAANLYRYFQNKQDIAVECCERCMGQRSDDIRKAVRQPNLSASERLRMFAISSLRNNLDNLENTPKIKELIEFISEEHKNLVRDKVRAQCATIAEILAYGNETGEFDVADVIKAAGTVHASLVLFDFPLFDGLFSREEFEVKANDVVDLLVNGLRRR